MGGNPGFYVPLHQFVKIALGAFQIFSQVLPAPCVFLFEVKIIENVVLTGSAVSCGYGSLQCAKHFSLSIGLLLTHLVSCNCRIEARFKGGVSHMIGSIGIEQKREKDVTHYVTVLQNGML